MRRYAPSLLAVLYFAWTVPAGAACDKTEPAPVASAGGGEILVSWQALRSENTGICLGSQAVAAIGSTTTGFTSLGPYGTGRGEFSAPTGGFLDNAGDG